MTPTILRHKGLRFFFYSREELAMRVAKENADVFREAWTRYFAG